MAIYVYTDEFIREPWENTYAYYPLTANANDTSGNNRNLTADSSITYSTQNGAFLPNSRHTGMLEPFNISTTSQRTFSRWENMLWLAWQTDAKWIDICSPGSWYRITQYTNTTKFAYTYNNSAWWSASAPYIDFDRQLNQWNYYTITIGENRQIKMYFNGVVKISWTVNSFTSQYFRWWQERDNSNARQLYWYLKDIIIESKARTDQEVSDYFNGTKSNYGIQ